MRVNKDQRPSLSFFSCIILVSCIICPPALLQAQMSEISDAELSHVSAQSGITQVFGNTQMRITLDSYRISDTDHSPANWMEFNNISVGDGQGGYFSIDTPAYFYDFNMLDIATDASGRTMVYMNLSTHVEPRTYTVDNFVFCDQDLGSLQLENLTMGASDKLIVGGRMNGESGINLEYQTKIDIDSFEYTYNNQPTSLIFSGIHLSQHASGAPEDPSSWVHLGKFKFGDFQDGNPMTIDVGTSDDNVTSAFVNIPMTGSARVEAVNFDGNIFGPCAIDGIKVHHLGIQISGN